ncbi:hypothetical protein DOY81_009322 [Sarcophaga bullata]|nr:hypothetical protein DOY81_009322 [Sarcophaga bullata]
MKKRVAKKRQSHLPIYIALGVLMGSIFIALFTDLKRPSAATGEENLDDNGDNITEPYFNAFRSATERPPKPPPPHPKRFPITKNITHLDLNRMRNEPQIRINKTYFELPKAEGPFKEWEDFEGLMTELQRMGMGEQGKKVGQENGFNALLSDYISVNRSLADVENEGCLAKQYSAKLPTVSVVIPFYNEYFSVLIRTLYSIVRRSPKELLKEIIIVDDGSDREYLKQELDNFIAANFPPNLVQIVRQNERTGLINSPLAGARKATADVILFRIDKDPVHDREYLKQELDNFIAANFPPNLVQIVRQNERTGLITARLAGARKATAIHIECGYNWLPPLLQPIALNPKVATSPIVDLIDHGTFAYTAAAKSAVRGAFDWNMIYKLMDQLPEFTGDITEPYPNPL